MGLPYTHTMYMRVTVLYQLVDFNLVVDRVDSQTAEFSSYRYTTKISREKNFAKG